MNPTDVRLTVIIVSARLLNCSSSVYVWTFMYVEKCLVIHFFRAASRLNVPFYDMGSERNCNTISPNP